MYVNEHIRKSSSYLCKKVPKIISNQYITLHQRMLGAFVSEIFISDKALNETIFNESNHNWPKDTPRKKIIIKTSQQNETEEEEVDFYCAYDFKKKLINELNSPSFY